MSAPPAKPPGFFAAALIVARKDLRIEGRTKETLLASLLFAVVELVIFGFAFDGDTLRRLGPGKVVPGLLWITLAFSAIVGFTRSFRLSARGRRSSRSRWPPSIAARYSSGSGSPTARFS